MKLRLISIGLLGGLAFLITASAFYFSMGVITLQGRGTAPQAANNQPSPPTATSESLPQNRSPETGSAIKRQDRAKHEGKEPGGEAQLPNPPDRRPEDPQRLRSRLEQMIQDHEGEVGFALTDLRTGGSIEVGGERRILSASTIKIFVLLSVLRDVQQGSYSLESVVEDMEAMMSWSDDEATATLTMRTGFDAVNQLMAEAGMLKSVYSSWPGVPFVYRGYEGETYLTARDVNLALSKLYQGRILSPPYTQLALEMMSHSVPWQNTIIPSLLPEDTFVAHKIGYLPWGLFEDQEAYNDAGIVILEAGRGSRAFAITFLSQQNRDHQEAANLGAQLSRMAYDFFQAGGSIEP